MIDTLDITDTPWIRRVIDVVEQAIGLPWRAALDEIELAPIASHRLSAVTSALRRSAGSRSQYTALARQARGLVFGAPVFTNIERRARIAAASISLGITERELEVALWADLPGERPIELPNGRPIELDVAAAANVQLVQRALRRAQLVRLRMWPDDAGLLRSALARGLLVTASRGGDGETALEIVGPLALFHRTSVYARALGQLVPLLGACERFELELECETGTAAYTARLASPVLLPLAPAAGSAAGGAGSRIAEQLAIALARRAPELHITLAPPPIGAHLLCPDLVVGDWHIELVGFWTREYLARKLDRYRAAGIEHVILCVDDARSCAGRAGSEADDPPAGVIGYAKRVDADRVLAEINLRSYRSRGA